MIPLIRKDISGYGYYHFYHNDETGETITQKCTQEEYEAMGGTGGHKNNPVLKGHTWFQSSGGVPEVDGRLLNDGEYIDIGDRSIAKLGTTNVLLESGDLDVNDNFVGTIK